MPDSFSWLQIVIALLAASGGVAGLVALGNLVVGLWDRRRKTRLEHATQKLNDTVELKRLAAEADHVNFEAVKDSLFRIIEERKQEITDLKCEIIELRQSHSLSRPTVVKIYQAVKGIRQQVNILDTLINSPEFGGIDHKSLADEISVLRQRLDELEQALP